MRKLFGVALILVATSGCGDKKKIEQCNALISVINAGVAKVQKSTSATPDGGAAMSELNALADEMETIGKEAAKIKLTVPELKKMSTDYQALAAEVAVAARELATAVDNVDIEKIHAAQGRMDKAVKREDPLVEQLNKFCQQP